MQQLRGRLRVTAATVILSELELDALTELVNLGVSRAATNLAVMVREEVTLTVPKVALMGRTDAIRTLSERESRDLVAVHQTFDGAIVGRALLIFPEENSLELVRSLVGAELSQRRHHRARAGSARRDGQRDTEQLPGDDRELAAEHA